MNDKVIVLHAQDNVGTAVADLATGDIIELPGRNLEVTESVPFGHKIALAPIGRGAAVIKYGELIGIAMSDVATGACVHVHNVESQRGRGDLGTAGSQ
jgi:altronate dehydratase small subunit